VLLLRSGETKQLAAATELQEKEEVIGSVE
jgi:hypothetical protein